MKQNGEDAMNQRGMPTDKPQASAYVEPWVKNCLQYLASQDDRSMSNYLERLIVAHVESAIADGKIPSEKVSEFKAES